MIRQINKDEISECGDVIRKAFAPVAEKFGVTRENCPRHTSFITDERLCDQFSEGRPMFAFFDEGKICGYFSLSIREGRFELDNLAVLPEKQKKGLGSELLSYAFTVSKKMGADELNIGIIDEYTELRRWYEKHGFRYLGSKKFPGFCFTAGFMKISL